MATANFNNVMDEVFSHEGGYVNHPKDPGGETNYGIAKRSHPDVDIRNLTRTQAAAIYRREYWIKVRGDELPAGLDLVAMDGAVNSGVKRGAQWLQRGIGLTGKSVDGAIGPVTVAAAKAADVQKAVKDACAARMSFLHGLSTFKTFGRGWSRRVAEVEAAALKMHFTATTAAQTAARKVAEEARAAAAKAKVEAAGAATSVAAGAGTTIYVDGTTETSIVAAISVLTAVLAAIRTQHQKNRAGALEAAAISIAEEAA